MEVLLRIWAGHSWHGITHKYTLQERKRDVTYRKLTAEQLVAVSICLPSYRICLLYQLHPRWRSRISGQVHEGWGAQRFEPPPFWLKFQIDANSVVSRNGEFSRILLPTETTFRDLG